MLLLKFYLGSTIVTMIGTNETSKTLNTFLDILERKVHEARKKLLEANSGISFGSKEKSSKKESAYTLLLFILSLGKSSSFL